MPNDGKTADMLTCCPECTTHFRVSRQQLAVAGGMVRCGHCGAAFHACPPEGEETSEVMPMLGLTSEAASATPDSSPLAGLTTLQPSPLPPSLEGTPGAPLLPPSPAGPPATRLRIAWTLANLLLILILGGQWLWWNRHDLDDPLGVRLVTELCRWAPCQTLPKRAPELIQVLERSLAAPPEQPGVLRFQLRLVSRASHPQPYPRLELHLFDHLEQPVAARRFFPADYLPAGQDPAALLAPNRPLELHLDLQDPGSQVIGFQIDFL